MRSSNWLISMIVLVICVALCGCKTQEDYRRESEIKNKREYLTSLKSQISELDDEIVRQQAILMVEKRRVEKAVKDQKLTQNEYDKAFADLARDQNTLAGLKKDLNETRLDFADLIEQNRQDRLSEQRRKDLANEIAELRDQIRALEQSIERRTAARAKQVSN